MNAVTPSAYVNVAGQTVSVTDRDQWVLLQGEFTAEGSSTVFQIVNNSGTLYAGDMVLMPGEKVEYWQQAANEVYTDEMTFAGGILSVGNSRDSQHAEMSGQYFAITSNSSGKRLAYFAGETAEFGKTLIRGSLEVQPENTTNSALSILPQGNGHVFFTVND